MSGYVVRDPAGTLLHETDDFDAAFSFRARWNLARLKLVRLSPYAAPDEPAPICQVYDRDDQGAEVLIDRVAMIHALAHGGTPS